MYQHGFQNSPCLANALSTHDDNTPMRKRTFRAMDYLKRPSLKSCQIYICMVILEEKATPWNAQMNLKVMVCSCDLRVCTSKMISNSGAATWVKMDNVRVWGWTSLCFHCSLMQKCVTVTHQQQIKTRICKNLALIRMQFWSASSLTNKLLLYNFNIISQIAHCSVYCELWKIALKLRGAMCRAAEKGHRLFFLRCENAGGNLKVLPSKHSLCRCMCARTYLTKQLFNKTTAVLSGCPGLFPEWTGSFTPAHCLPQSKSD